jgi:2-iminobutanoate/2-iminopropanoate deaminase
MKERIQTANAPQAIGPYSQAIKIGNFLFMSGQIPLDPVAMKLVEGDVRVQTKQVLKNMAAVLEAAGASFDKVVKTTVFLKDMADFKAFNEEYTVAFNPEKTPPARSTVAVAGLPLGALVEIEAIVQL